MSTQKAPQQEYLGLLVAGYTMAFVLPIGGLVVALVLGERRGLGHMLAIAFLSVIVGMAWFALILRAAGGF